jgi:hypothetical protein
VFREVVAAGRNAPPGRRTSQLASASSTYFLEEKSPSNPKKTDLSALKTGSELHSINLQQSQEVTDDYSGRVKVRKED